MTLKDLHETGATKEQIEDALRAMPFVSLLHLFPEIALTSVLPLQHPAMVRGVSALKSRGKTTFFCLSNSNIIYISTILKVGFVHLVCGSTFLTLQ